MAPRGRSLTDDAFLSTKKDAAPRARHHATVWPASLFQNRGNPHWLRHSFIMSLLMGASFPMPLWKSSSFAS